MSKNMKTVLIVGGILIAAIIALQATLGLATGGEACGYGTTGTWMMGGFGIGWLMPLLWVLLAGAIVWAVIGSSRGLASSESQSYTKAGSALEVLKDRYARGEIGKEEYEEKRKGLT